MADGVGDEEDEVLQSSLPLYLDHIFGASVGFSQTFPGDPPPVHQSPPPPTTILESQGFNHTASTCVGGSHALSAGEVRRPVWIPERSPAGRDSQNSMLLFSSPDDNSQSRDTAAASAGRTDDQSGLKETNSSSSVAKTTARKTAPHGDGKRGKKRKISDLEPEYRCPPSCCPLGDCTSSDRTVSIIAVVVQGQCTDGP